MIVLIETAQMVVGLMLVGGLLGIVGFSLYELLKG